MPCVRTRDTVLAIVSAILVGVELFDVGVDALRRAHRLRAHVVDTFVLLAKMELTFGDKHPVIETERSFLFLLE